MLDFLKELKHRYTLSLHSVCFVLPTTSSLLFLSRPPLSLALFTCPFPHFSQLFFYNSDIQLLKYQVCTSLHPFESVYSNFSVVLQALLPGLAGLAKALGAAGGDAGVKSAVPAARPSSAATYAMSTSSGEEVSI